MAKVLVLLEDGFVDYEFRGPTKALKSAGHEVVVASSERGKQLVGKQGGEIISNFSYEEVDPVYYDALFLPGGKSPEKVRTYPQAIEITKHFANNQKIIAAICHGPQILVTAGVLKGKTATSWPLVADELRDAGATYVNQEVVVDDNLITSRNPSDVPAFTKAFLTQLG